LFKRNRKETFIVHGETKVTLQEVADSFKINAGLNSGVASIFVDFIRDEAKDTTTLAVPFYTFVSTVISYRKSELIP